ncbi:hypothetical protein ACFLMW_003739 [Salmonella enterica]
MVQLTPERIDTLIRRMEHYHTENEKMRQHVLEKPELHANALEYSQMWLDIKTALEIAKEAIEAP